MLGSVAVLPGLVNAHTHLELSWLRGRVPPAGDFLSWVGQLMRLRTRLETADDEAAVQAMRAALAEMQATGTAAVGDVSNALVSPPVLREAVMPAVVFHELLGFRDADGRSAVAESRPRRASAEGGGVRVVAAAHAPFSVSAELFTAIRDEVRAPPASITSVHVGESPEEVQLLRDGSGPWRTRLEELGAWRSDWVAPGRGPGDYLCDLGVIAAGTLAVHGVQLTDRELARMAGDRRDAGDVPAQQPLGRGRPAADRPLLHLGRPRRGRDRQPGERPRPQPVRRAGGDARGRARAAGPADPPGGDRGRRRCPGTGP